MVATFYYHPPDFGITIFLGIIFIIRLTNLLKDNFID